MIVDVRRRRPGDAGTRVGESGGDHLDLGAPTDPDLILSNTARAGVTGFLKTLAREVAADGVTVNSLQPGLHDTERIRSLGGGDPSGIPAGRLGTAAEFGAVAAFLCSEHAAFVTGVALPIDGGAHEGLQ